jgi:hypothetical protein
MLVHDTLTLIAVVGMAAGSLALLTALCVAVGVAWDAWRGR